MTLWSEKGSSDRFFLKRKDSAEKFVGPFGLAFGLAGFVLMALLVAWLTGLI